MRFFRFIIFLAALTLIGIECLDLTDYEVKQAIDRRKSELQQKVRSAEDRSSQALDQAGHALQQRAGPVRAEAARMADEAGQRTEGLSATGSQTLKQAQAAGKQAKELIHSPSKDRELEQTVLHASEQIGETAEKLIQPAAEPAADSAEAVQRQVEEGLSNDAGGGDDGPGEEGEEEEER